MASPAGVAGVELLLEPNTHPAAKAYQVALFADRIPVTIFFVDDLQHEYERLRALDVKFPTPLTPMGDVTVAFFEDTCGNLVKLTQEG